MENYHQGIYSVKDVAFFDQVRVAKVEELSKGLLSVGAYDKRLDKS